MKFRGAAAIIPGPGALVGAEGLGDALLDRLEGLLGDVGEAAADGVGALLQGAADAVGDARADAADAPMSPKMPPPAKPELGAGDGGVLAADRGRVQRVEAGPLVRVAHDLGDVDAFAAPHRHELVVAVAEGGPAGQDAAAGEALRQAIGFRSGMPGIFAAVAFQTETMPLL
jgi:hypothetical protein